jgi:two-component system chemotaxis response regulator CheY
MTAVMVGPPAPGRLSLCTAEAEDSVDPNRANLLVVEDNQPIRTIIVKLLQSMGFGAIDEACDGHETLTLFRRKPYDVVITDWQMPRVSGIELLRAIRHDGERSETPVLVLTGNATAARAKEAIDAGANGFVAKPFGATEFCERVLRVVSYLAPVTTLEAPREVAHRRPE